MCVGMHKEPMNEAIPPSPATTRFLLELRQTLERWRARECNYDTFTKTQEAIWSQISHSGLQLEGAVFRAIAEMKPRQLARQMGVGAPLHHAPNAGFFAPPTFLNRHFYITAEASLEGNQILRATEVCPQDTSAGRPAMNVFIKELADEVSCHSYGAGASWAVVAVPERACVEIRLTRKTDAELAAQVAANVVASNS